MALFHFFRFFRGRKCFFPSISSAVSSGSFPLSGRNCQPWFKWWVSNNRPRHRSIYHAMKSSGAPFKHELRQCKLDEQLIVSKKLADHTKNHEINDF